MLEKIGKFVNPAPLLKRKWCWVKIHEVEIILAAGVIFVSLISFAAGYLVAQEQLKEPIHIEQGM